MCECVCVSVCARERERKRECARERESAREKQQTTTSAHLHVKCSDILQVCETSAPGEDRINGDLCAVLTRHHPVIIKILFQMRRRLCHIIGDLIVENVQGGSVVRQDVRIRCCSERIDWVRIRTVLKKQLHAFDIHRLRREMHRRGGFLI